MKVILLLLLIFTSEVSQAQYNFFKTYFKPSHERAFSAVEMPDGSFLLAGEIQQSGYNDVNEGYLVKLTSMGEVVQSKIINPVNSTRLCLLLPCQFENASYICIGSSDSLAGDDFYGNKIFYAIDDNLNILFSKQFGYKYNYLNYPWQYKMENDSTMYLLSDNIRINQNNSLERFVDVVKYRLPFDSLLSYTSPNYAIVGDLLLKSNDTILDLYLFPSNRRITLDENLQYLQTSNYPIDFRSNICTTLLDENGYLIVGEYADPSTGNDELGCLKMDNNDAPIDSLIYNPSEDTSFYAGARENTAINGNFIYIAGFYNVNAMWFPYNYNPSWVTITKADLNMNMISTHFYGGDAQYCPYSIIPTSDGGVFVTGYSYDYINNLPNNNYELDIFALKTDADGLITELPDQAKAHDAIIYPNPGIEFLNIQSGPQISGAEFYLFDVNGKAVIAEKITNTLLNVNTAYLPSGTYPWQIVFKNKVIESGKWVKN